MGLGLDKAFNAHIDKTREGQRSMCMAHAHNITREPYNEAQESTKRVLILHKKSNVDSHFFVTVRIIMCFF